MRRELKPVQGDCVTRRRYSDRFEQLHGPELSPATERAVRAGHSEYEQIISDS